MMEFLLDLLREERQKRQELEREVMNMRMILEPLQQQEMDRIQANRNLQTSSKRHVVECDCYNPASGVDEIDCDHSV